MTDSDTPSAPPSADDLRADFATRMRADDIWIATFAAAYAGDVRDLERMATQVGKSGDYPDALSFARSGADVERAMTIANDAVRRARAWIEANGHPVNEDPRRSER